VERAGSGGLIRWQAVEFGEAQRATLSDPASKYEVYVAPLTADVVFSTPCGLRASGEVAASLPAEGYAAGAPIEHRLKGLEPGRDYAINVLVSVGDAAVVYKHLELTTSKSGGGGGGGGGALAVVAVVLSLVIAAILAVIAARRGWLQLPSRPGWSGWSRSGWSRPTLGHTGTRGFRAQIEQEMHAADELLNSPLQIKSPLNYQPPEPIASSESRTEEVESSVMPLVMPGNGRSHL